MHFIGISSACINPITYALVNDSFRDAASLMICPRLVPPLPHFLLPILSLPSSDLIEVQYQRIQNELLI